MIFVDSGFDSIPEIERIHWWLVPIGIAGKRVPGIGIPTFRQCQDPLHSGVPESPLPLNPMTDREEAFPMERLLHPPRLGCNWRR